MTAKRPKKKPPALPAIPPQAWGPRDYQRCIFDARSGLYVPPRGGPDVTLGGSNGWAAGEACDRFLLIWHRRGGKDRTGLELVRKEADERVGSYWHLYPLHIQAERAIWNGVDPQTKTRLLELVFPLAMRAEVENRNMFMRFRNGSTYQLLGSDKYDRLVGSNVLGVLFSEWALCDPRAWPYIMPILLENGGWAAFITTYRGRNHAYQMVKRLAPSKDWYVDVRTIRDTTRADGTPVVSMVDVEAERESLIALHGAARADALIQEEFFCNPMASLPGSVYGKAVASMLAEGRA